MRDRISAILTELIASVDGKYAPPGRQLPEASIEGLNRMLDSLDTARDFVIRELQSRIS